MSCTLNITIKIITISFQSFGNALVCLEYMLGSLCNLLHRNCNEFDICGISEIKHFVIPIKFN